MWTTEAVLVEVGNALSAFDRAAAVGFIEHCYQSPNLHVITVTTALFRDALQLYATRADKQWGLTDCISFVVMQEQKLVLALTADHHFRGTRVGIETVLYEYIHQSQSPEAIARRYPALTLEQVYATITYYLHHQAKVEAYLADWLAHGERMRAEQERNPTPAMLKLWQMRTEQTSALRVAEV